MSSHVVENIILIRVEGSLLGGSKATSVTNVKYANQSSIIIEMTGKNILP